MNGKSGKKPQTEFIRDKRGKMQLVSKCHGREVREGGRDVAIICECHPLFYRRLHSTSSVTKLTDVLTDVTTDVLTDV